MDDDASVQPHTVEKDAFASAFVEHAPRLLKYLSRQLEPAQAEDVLGETFCVAWQQRDRYDADAGSMAAWLFGIAVRKAAGHKRSFVRASRAAARLCVFPAISDDEADRVAEQVDARTTTAQLATALRALPGRDRNVLLLSTWAQLDHAEIAAALNIPAGTVRSRLHRARKALLAALPADQPTNWSSR
jgi:RNA polymerase sigma-70 factor (ECF subfamily)